MQAQGFIRADRNEVNLLDILPTKMKVFSSRAEQESYAKAHEAKFGVLVRRPWEKDEEFTARKEGFAFKSQKRSPEIGMAPDRARRELRNAQTEYDGIEDIAEDSMRLRKVALVKYMNQLEKVLGLPVTEFKKLPEGAKLIVTKSDEVPEATQKILSKYLGEPNPKSRIAAIHAITDLRLLQLIRDSEPQPEIADEAVKRLVVLGG